MEGMIEPVPSTAQVERMKRDWDARASENARYWVATGKEEWTDEEWWSSGRATVREQVLNDMTNICQGMDPKRMKVLEIGCGAGRITRALAEVFGLVYGIDISSEMVRQARLALRDVPNAFVFENNGKDLSVLGDTPIDFAFSMIVFQHIPSREVIECYVRDVHRLLRPGGLFKFQVQGDPAIESEPDDTWLGVPFSDADAVAMADKVGFEPRHRHGAGDQYFWLWYFKR